MTTLAEFRQSYPQYDDMSDTALADSLHSRHYSDIPREDFNRRIGITARSTAADPVIDVAKSAGVGVARGALGVLGAPGDIGNLAARGAEAAGVPEGARRMFGQVASGVPFLRPFATGPTSQDLQRRVEQHTGEFYQPQTTAGKYARTIGEFAPGAALPASKLGRLANVVAPGAASEAAGQATEGTAAEPYARAGGALVGGIGANAALRPATSSAAQRAAVPSSADRIEQVSEAATRGYQSPAVTSVQFRPGVVDALAGTMERNLDRSKFNVRRAPETRGILDDMRTPVNGTAHTIEDLQTAKEQLGRLAGNFNNPVEQAAASRAVENITRYLGRMPQGHLAAGDARAASTTWNEARQNYAVAKTAEKVSDKLRNAELQAGSANTGANLGNTTRQKLRPLLTNAKQGRGLTDDEASLIEQTVQGSRFGNALRSMGDATGGGGGARSLVALLGGAAASSASGFGLIGAALPIVGSALRGAGNAITVRKANKIVDAILSRAPAIEGIEQRGRAALSDRQRRALAAQLVLASRPQQ